MLEKQQYLKLLLEKEVLSKNLKFTYEVYESILKGTQKNFVIYTQIFNNLTFAKLNKIYKINNKIILFITDYFKKNYSAKNETLNGIYIVQFHKDINFVIDSKLLKDSQNFLSSIFFN